MNKSESRFCKFCTHPDLVENLDSYPNGWVQGVGVQNCKILDSVFLASLNGLESCSNVDSVLCIESSSCMSGPYIFSRLNSPQIPAKRAFSKILYACNSLKSRL